MKARILRGANEVGGSCVELESSGKRLVVDLGRPLSSGFDETVALPPIAGLETGGDSTLLGVFISHSHPDHYGLAAQVPGDVPMFIGAAAGRILDEATFFSPASLRRKWAGQLCDGEPLEVGPFTITPLLVDHSAYDAFALVVQAGGRTLLYSGDLRGHGNEPRVFDRFLDRITRPVHALVLEGTRIGRAEAEGSATRSEADVERELVGVSEATSGLILAVYSAQNLDRLSTIYASAISSGRELVIDPYVHAVAVAAGPEVPRVGFPHTRLYVPQSMRVKIKKSGEFDRIDRLRRFRLFPDDLASEPGRFMLTFRTSMLAELERAGCLEDAQLIWSMWPGYLREERMSRFHEALENRGIQMDVIHASGHATVADLQVVAERAAAQRVVPIHTAAPEMYPELFDRVEVHPDGEWWSV